MAEPIKVLDAEGVKVLFDLLSLQDYPNNDVLMAVINAIDETKANKDYVDRVDLDLRNTITNVADGVDELGLIAIRTSIANNAMDTKALHVSTVDWITKYNNGILDNDNDWLKSYGLTKVSNKVPSISQIQNAEGILTVALGLGNDAQFIEVGGFLGADFTVEVLDGLVVIAAGEDADAAIYALIVLEDIIGDLDFPNTEKGVYFRYYWNDNNPSSSWAVTGLRIADFDFNNEDLSDFVQKEELEDYVTEQSVESLLSSKLNKNQLFVGTLEEYNIAHANGNVQDGAIVILTDVD